VTIDGSEGEASMNLTKVRGNVDTGVLGRKVNEI